MPTNETPGRGRSAKAVLRALAMGAAYFWTIAPPAQILAQEATFVRVQGLAGPSGTEPSDLIEARVTLGPGGRDIRLSGDLTDGVAARLAALLAVNSNVERLHLTSDGGLVDEAEALGALVTARKLATYVPDSCASACTLVFVRGRERYLAVGGQLGFHAPYEVGSDGRIETVDPESERAAYHAAGLASDFVARIMTVAPEDIWIPETTQLREAGVVTEVVGTDRFPDSTLDADSSLQAARAVILRNLPIMASLDATTIDDAAVWFREGYLDGRTEAEAIAGLRQRALDALQQRIRAADDATVLALGQTIRTGLPVAGAEGCTALNEHNLLTLDETLRRARPGGDGFTPVLRRISSESDVAMGGAQKPIATAGLGTPPAQSPCPRAIEAIGAAGDHAPHEAAVALRAILLGDLPARIASAALR